MTDHLCLKWNNHSSSFLKYISKIQIDEKFCDATIACQEKYFPVHRIVLSTCSDYFAEIFDRMVSPHPYIIFKDIESREMNLLLTYMYKGEINVTQDMLPSLIKAAEALRIKGLAVPDEEVENKGRKSKSDESKRRKCSDSLRENETNMQVESLNSKSTNSESTLYENASKHQLPTNEVMHVKEEPVDVSEYGSMPDGELDKFPTPSVNIERQKDIFQYASAAKTLEIKSEEIIETDSFDDHSLETTWTNMDDECDVQSTLSSGRTSSQNDTSGKNCGQQDLAYECIPENQPGTYLIMNLPRKLNFKCSFCDYENYKKCHVRTHEMQKHTGERPFPCTTCSKKFVKKNDLERHIRVHTGEKPYHCHWCGIKFSLRGNLQQHMLKKTCRQMRR